MKWPTVIFNVVWILPLLVLAQAPTDRGGVAPAFEAASVKLDKNAFVPRVSGRMTGGPGTNDPTRFTYTQQTLRPILVFAWDLMPDQLYGPAWLDDPQGDRFTITATLPPNTTVEQFHVMLQNLLTSRFHLELRHESRTYPGYDLVAAGEPKLKEWVPDPNAPTAPTGPLGRDAQGFPNLSPGRPGFATVLSTGSGAMRVRLTNRQSLDDFARSLGALVGIADGAPSSAPKPRVVNKTGLDPIVVI